MVDPLRIAHVTATFPPYSGGTGNVAYHNALELVRRGHDVHVFTARIDGAPAEETLEGIQVHRLKPWLRYGNAFFLPLLYSYLLKFDLVHLHLPFYGGSEAVLFLRMLKKIPLVITYHQDVELSGPAGWVSRIHDRLIGRRLMQSADRACFTSLDYGRASKLGPLLQDGRLNEGELPNGVDETRFTPGLPDPELAGRYDAVNRSVILFVGALDRAHYFKGVHHLIQAVAIMQRDDIRLIITGKGDMVSGYRRQVRDLGLEGVVHFAGFVPDDQLPGFYHLADVTILPSTTAGEAFGLVLIESMACGTPVIASDLPGVRTVVADGKDGFLVPPGDPAALAGKIQYLLDLSPSDREQISRFGRQKVSERYAWSHLGSLLETYYRQALDSEHSQSLQPSLNWNYSIDNKKP